MRSRIAALGAMLLSCALPAFAQFTTVSASNVGGAGNLVANGTVYWQPVTAARIGSAGGQVLGVPYQATVTAGAFSISVPDTLATDPTSCYAVTVIDKLTGATLLGAGLAGDGVHANAGGSYGCVQPTGSTWNFDSYVPPASPPTVYEPTPGPIGPPLNPRGAYSSIATYAPGDLVSSGGSNFACITGCSGVSPIAGANWELINIPKNIRNATNVMSYGAVGDGVTDDTATIDAAIAQINLATFSGGTLYFPPGQYKISSRLTTFTVPVTVVTDGTCNDNLTKCVTEIVQATMNTGVLQSTSQYFRVENVAVVSGPGLAGTPQTAGIGIDYCDPTDSYVDHFDAEDNQTEGFFTGIRDCNSEAGSIRFNRLGDNYWDAMLLGTSGSSNLGDTQIHGNTCTGAGSSANACVNYQYASGGFVTSNLDDQGITPNWAPFSYFIYTSANGAPYTVIGNHAEHYGRYCMYLLSGPTQLTANGCYKASTAATGPDIYVASSVGETVAANYFQNGTATVPIAEAILFQGGPYNQNVVIDESNSARGYTALQSGLTLGIYGNSDTSTLAGATPTLLSLTLHNPASEDARLTVDQTVQSQPGYPLQLMSASGQNLRFSPGGAWAAFMASNAFYPAADNSMEDGDPGVAWSHTDTYSLTLHGATPSVASGRLGLGVTTTAASSCGSLSGAAGCLEINIGGTAHYIPYW